MFNPNGGAEIPQGNSIKFNQLFTGVVDAIPLCWNPTREDLIEIKGIPEDRQEKIKEQKYVAKFERDGIQVTALNLLCKINPNELLGEKDEEGNLIRDEDGEIVNKKYKDDHYFNVSFFISAKDEQSQAGNYRFINESAQSTWAPSLEAIKENPKMDWFDSSTARKAKEGEVVLYNLLYAWYKKVGSKNKPITGFKLGEDPTETFEEIVAGDVTILNDMLNPKEESFQYFSHDDGEVRKIAMLLGVKASTSLNSEGQPYQNQTVFTSRMNSSFAKEGRSLPKDAIQAVNEGRFKANNQGSFEFQPYDPLKAVQDITPVDQGDVEVEDTTDLGDGINGDFGSMLDDPSFLD